MDIKEFFGDGVLNGEEFEKKLAESGMVLLEAREGGYVPASRERELTEALESQRESHEKALNHVRARSALMCELIKNGAHNPTLAATAIGLDDISGDEREIAQAAQAKVAALKSSEAYMFAPCAEGGETIVSTGASHGGTGVDTDSMSDSEYYRYRNVK